MTTTFSPAAQTAISGSSGGLARRIEGWAYALVTYWDRRVAIKTLRGLDDRALRDIGIVRSQIEAAVDGALNPELASAPLSSMRCACARESLQCRTTSTEHLA